MSHHPHRAVSRRSPINRLSGFAAAVWLVAAPLAMADDPSAAEQLLFNAPHLSALKPPTQLLYHYEETEAGQTKPRDEVRMQLQRDAQGACCAVKGEFLTGAQALSLPDIDAARSNPVLLYFLEYEVRRLARTTGGNANHFRRRIREALVTASVTPTRITWQGRDLAAREVQISPFENDPFRTRFEPQAGTRYRFVLADEVPGAMFQLSATVPGRNVGDPPQRVDQLTLSTGASASATANVRNRQP